MLSHELPSHIACILLIDRLQDGRQNNGCDVCMHIIHRDCVCGPMDEIESLNTDAVCSPIVGTIALVVR